LTMKVECPICGEGITQKAIREIISNDMDPNNSMTEKMFQFSQWWVESGDGHQCEVVELL
jgi:hypothetical protein